MANRDNPHGLLPVGRTLHGGPGMVMERSKPATDGTAIFLFDAVAIATAGAITAGRGAAFMGVALNGGALSTLTNHLIIADPLAVFDVQDNDDTDGVTEANIGKNADLECNAGSATTGISGHELDESSINTTNTLDVMILGLVNAPDNAYGEHARVEVVFNRHALAIGRTGV